MFSLTISTLHFTVPYGFGAAARSVTVISIPATEVDTDMQFIFVALGFQTN